MNLAYPEVSRQHPLLSGHPHAPTHGLTLGMADLLRTRRIVLLAFGPAKRPVLDRLRKPVVDPRFPVSLLWLHPELTVICDRVAAGPAADN